METDYFRIENYDALWLLWALPAMIGFYVWNFYRKRRCLRIFAALDMIGSLNNNVSAARQIIQGSLLLTAIIAIVAALTQPGWNPRPQRVERKGRDVIILLDVSRSMLAEDLYPNRLEQARLAIGDLIDELHGDRIGVIAFAGTSTIKCPLTHNYPFAKMTLDELHPQSVSQGGTLIGDAIRKAVDEVFDEDEKDFKDIIIISDGEDTNDSFAIDAAARAAGQGVRIFAIGLGDKIDGARIPIEDEFGNKNFLKYQDEEVWSKLQDQTLREVALSAGGAYWPVGTDAFDLAKIYNNTIAGGGQKELESTTAMRYEEKFQIFLALALALLILEAAISERSRAEKGS